MNHQLNNTVRIIGGRLRGRKLHFISAPGLRPSGDRVRETLFNWLMNDVIDAYCLDAFAGTGALGFEAISRGASEVIFLEDNPNIIKTLNQTAQEFKLGDAVKIHQGNSLNYLQISKPKKPFDIIFCDPPFKQGLLLKTLDLLNNFSWVKPGSLIYTECEHDAMILSELAARFNILKQKETAQVVYSLLVI